MRSRLCLLRHSLSRFTVVGLFVVASTFGFAVGANLSQAKVSVIPQIYPLLMEDLDLCPDDPLKTQPGDCGCGIADLDSDKSGVTDCLEDGGFTNIRQFLVASSGSYSLGDTSADFNSTRDSGSKIVYFNPASGNNDTAEVYWWDGSHIVDSSGNIANPVSGILYGTDPLYPNEDAIKTFATFLSSGDDRLKTQAGSGGPRGWRFSGVAGGYPDWFLFRRGQIHDTFDNMLTGGRSEEEPMVITAYGPEEDGRAIMAPSESSTNPFAGHNWGREQSWLHHVLFSLELHTGYGYYGTHQADSYNDNDPVTALIEDCYWPTLNKGIIVYPPKKTIFRRSIITNSWYADAHNQGYYTSGFENQVTFDEVIFYKNGYKTNPLTDPDPRRDIFSRNVYQGGGARMGHTYRNVLFADGASGCPQMRLGGLIENSLIIEGYWYSSTLSNSAENDWLISGGQDTTSAYVTNNVQLIYGYPTANDPDTDGVSDGRAQPKWGYSLSGATFGATVSGNIISGAMLENDLDAGYGNTGLKLFFSNTQYSDGNYYTQKDNSIHDNIVYKVKNGVAIEGDSEGVRGIKVYDNVVMATTPIYHSATNLTSQEQLLVSNNRFYADEALGEGDWQQDNSLLPSAQASLAENWQDPDRTLKRYVTEVLNLSILEWDDDPFLDSEAVAIRSSAGESYDPTGMKTFMAVATHMRKGGSTPIPDSGKPDMTADYPWDKRFTARAVVNWIREGFGLAELP